MSSQWKSYYLKLARAIRETGFINVDYSYESQTSFAKVVEKMNKKCRYINKGSRPDYMKMKAALSTAKNHLTKRGTSITSKAIADEITVWTYLGNKKYIDEENFNSVLVGNFNGNTVGQSESQKTHELFDAPRPSCMTKTGKIIIYLKKITGIAIVMVKH
jgi:predicted nucleic acid-binding Zn finger protein